MMRVLDLDLDFFLNKIAYDVDDCCGKRLDSSEYLVENEQKVRLFLEKQCGLSLENKIKGNVVEHHHEALFFWDDLIKEGKLKTPFSITHVDAHPDIWFGDKSITYIMTELTRLSIANRKNLNDIDIGKIKCGNYLTFAMALGWIEAIEFVYHEKWGGQDLNEWFFKDFDFKTMQLELKNYDYNIYIKNIERLKEITPLRVDPPITFKATSKHSFKSNFKYDIAILSKSPGYTPVTADVLIPIIKEYFII